MAEDLLMAEESGAPGVCDRSSIYILSNLVSIKVQGQHQGKGHLIKKQFNSN